jgi:hypothetical protein
MANSIVDILGMLAGSTNEMRKEGEKKKLTAEQTAIKNALTIMAQRSGALKSYQPYTAPPTKYGQAPAGTVWMKSSTGDIKPIDKTYINTARAKGWVTVGETYQEPLPSDVFKAKTVLPDLGFEENQLLQPRVGTAQGGLTPEEMTVLINAIQGGQ